MADIFPKNLATIGFKIAEAQAELKREEELLAEIEQKSKEAHSDLERITMDEVRLQAEKDRLTADMESYQKILFGEKRSCELLARCKHSLLSDLNRAKDKRHEFGEMIKVAEESISAKHARFDEYFLRSEKGSVLNALYKQIDDVKAEHGKLTLALIYQEELIALCKTLARENFPSVSSSFAASFIELALLHRDFLAKSERSAVEKRGNNAAICDLVILKDGCSEKDVPNVENATPLIDPPRHAPAAPPNGDHEDVVVVAAPSFSPEKTPESSRILPSSTSFSDRKKKAANSPPAELQTSCFPPQQAIQNEGASSTKQPPQNSRRIAPFSLIRSLPSASKNAVPEKSPTKRVLNDISPPASNVVSPLKGPVAPPSNARSPSLTPDDVVFKKPFSIKKTSPSTFATTTNAKQHSSSAVMVPSHQSENVEGEEPEAVDEPRVINSTTTAKTNSEKLAQHQHLSPFPPPAVTLPQREQNDSDDGAVLTISASSSFNKTKENSSFVMDWGQAGSSSSGASSFSLFGGSFFGAGGGGDSVGQSSKSSLLSASLLGSDKVADKNKETSASTFSFSSSGFPMFGMNFSGDANK